MDDGSTDDTVEVINKYLEKDARFQFHHRPSERPKGANACRNYGFEMSSGRFLIFLDSDDLLSDICLQHRVQTMLANTTLNFSVFTTQRFKGIINNNLGIANIDPEIRTKEAYLNSFLRYEFPWTIMSVIWDRNVLNLYSFNENLYRLQDVDFHIRILFDPSIRMKRFEVVDNFYRAPETIKQESSSFQLRVVSSFITILESYKEILSNDVAYRASFKRFCMIMSKAYLYQDIDKNKNAILKFEQIIKELNLLTNTEKILFYFQKKIIQYKLDKRTGIGMYRITRYLARQLEG